MRTSRIVAWSATAAIIAMIVIANIVPLVWALLTSLKGPQDVVRFPPAIYDFSPTIANYIEVIHSGMLDSVAVSLLYSLVSVAATLVIAFPTAYAFDRLRFRFRQPLFVAVIACIPLSLGAAALLIPNYVYFSAIGLTNTAFVLPIIYTAHQLPMAIWILKGSLEAIPKEIDEAAVVDGCSHVRILVSILLPLAAPAVAAASVLVFVGSWNEFVASSVMVSSRELRPIQPLVYSFIGYYGREWGLLSAASIYAVVPIFFVFFVFGRRIVSGLTAGSTK